MMSYYDQRVTGENGVVTRITPECAGPESPIPNIGCPGIAFPNNGVLSLVFQHGVPLALVRHIEAHVASKITFPRVAGLELVRQALDLACLEMMKLVNKGKLYRESSKPDDWVYIEQEKANQRAGKAGE